MKTKFLTFVLVILMLLSPMTVWAFSDVASGDWAADYIEILSSKELVSGYADDTFRPGAALTRAEAVVLLVNAKGLGQGLTELRDVECIFRDVEVDHWASAFINLAWERGLVSGYGDGTFQAERQVTRAEFITMLIRALEIHEPVGVAMSFVDHDIIPDWAKASVDLATRYSLIAGYPDGTFRPNQNVRRDEATAMLSSFLEEVGVYYDFYAQVSDWGNTRATLLINDKTYVIELTENMVNRLDVKDMESGQWIKGILDRQGKLAWIEKTTREEIDLIKTVSLRETRDDAQSLSSELGEDQDTWMTSYLSTAYDQSIAIQSAALLRQEMGMDEQLQGDGEIIAMIDSGIDPGLRSLQKTPTGEEKLLGFYDVTGEGNIVREGTILKTERYVELAGKTLDLEGIETLSGQVPYAYLYEELIGIDFNLNGHTQDEFLVLFADGKESGVYDRLYIDTDLDNRFGDEKPFFDYHETYERYNLSKNKTVGNFYVVLSELDLSGERAILGFDGNGHGTAMAAAASGYGEYIGIAPGSKLLVIKAFDASGQAQWRHIEQAIRLAVEKGATVVNMSLGYQDDITSGNNSITYMAEQFSERYGVVFVGAAGNLGPGSNSLTTPGNGESVLGVTGYLPASFASEILGFPLTSDVLWSSASNGPRDDGYLGIDAGAPGMGIFPMPLWHPSDYVLLEGTSVATALASGMVASFLSEETTLSHDIKETYMIDIIQDQAIPNPAWDVYQIGYGVMDYKVLDRWRIRDDYLSLSTWNKKLGVGKGLFGRDYTPGNLPLYVDYEGLQSLLLYWESGADWVQPVASLMVMPAGGMRTLPLQFHVPEEPGIYTTVISVSVLPNLLEAERISVGVVVPYQFEERDAKSQSLYWSQDIAPGQVERFFVEVGMEASHLQATLNARRKDVEYWFYNPQGQLMAHDALNSSALGTVNVEEPTPGIWEVVVVGGLNNSLQTSPLANVSVNLVTTVHPVTIEEVNNQYVLGTITKPISNSPVQWISLSVRDTNFKPVSGVTMDIEGRLYEVIDGWVRIQADRDLVERMADSVLQVKF